MRTKEWMIDTGKFRANAMMFGDGKKDLILIAGLNLQDAEGKKALLGLAYMYKIFTKDYTVYLFDRRQDLPSSFTAEQIAEDTAACMKQCGIAEADVFGISQGGMIAQYLALNHPELVHKLVLGVTASRPNDTLQRNIGNWCAMVRKGNMKGVIRDYFEHTYSEAYMKKYRLALPLLIRTMKTMEPSRFLTLAEACLTCDTYDRLKEIRCPVLVLGGKKDCVVTPEESEAIADVLGCELYMYDEYGHSAYEEAADFNDRVLEFLKRV